MRKVIFFLILLTLFSGSLASAALVDNGDGTVTDTGSGLMWQKATAPGTYTWQQALSYCENLSLAGHSDWRLPNLNELKSLADYSRYGPAIDPLLAPHTVSSYYSYYWSSTTYASNASYAWLVSFYDGADGNVAKSSSNYYYVRAVRGGQSGLFGSLVILKTGSGAGSVGSTPAGITCGMTCSAYFAKGAFVTLTATLDPGSTFTGWSGGGCYGRGTCTVNMNDNAEVTAGFSLSAAVISLSTASGPAQGNAPLTVQFTATPAVLVSQYNWDFNGDGKPDLQTSIGKANHTYETPGTFNATVTVLDYQGVAYTASPVVITVEDALPLAKAITFQPYYPESDAIPSWVMQGGKVFRYYRVYDDGGAPLVNVKIIYRYEGEMPTHTAFTDDMGFIAVETDWIDEIRTFKLLVLKEDGSEKADVVHAPSFFVNTTDRVFEQEWSLLFDAEASIGAGIGTAIGPVKFKTAEASLHGGKSIRMNLLYRHGGNTPFVSMANEYGTTLGVSVSAGLFAKAWENVAAHPDISVGFEAEFDKTAREGALFAFPGFLDESRSDHHDQILAASGMFFESFLNVTGDVIPGWKTLLTRMIDKITRFSEYQQGVTAGFDLGGSLLAGGSATFTNPFKLVEGSQIGFKFLNFKGEAVFSHDVLKMTKGTPSTKETYGLTGSLDFSLLKASLGEKFGDQRKNASPLLHLEDINLIPGTSGSIIEGGASLTLESDAAGLKGISLSQTTSSSRDGFLWSSTTTEKSMILDIDDREMCSIVSFASDLVGGLVNSSALLSFNPQSIVETTKTILDSAVQTKLGRWSTQSAEKNLVSIPIALEVGGGIKLGGELTVEAMNILRMTENSGIVSPKGCLMTEQYRQDDYINSNKKDIFQFIDTFKRTISDAVSDAVHHVVGDVTQAVQNGYAKVKEQVAHTWDGFSAIVSKLDVGQGSYVIRARIPSGIGRKVLDNALTAKTIGDVYIVNLKDGDGNPVSDFSAAPLSLTISYTDEMLQAAGVDTTQAGKLAIYWFDMERGSYLYQSGTVDTINRSVTASITKPGQYILGIDELPPVIADFKASDSTAQPILTARITDTLSGIDTSLLTFSLDGETRVDGTSGPNCFDEKIGLFKYIVTSPLSSGTHTAILSVKDTAGNTANSASLQFTVNTSLPVIAHVPVLTASAGGDLAIHATVTDDSGIARVMLFYKPEQLEYPYVSVEMTKGTNDTYSASIPSSYVSSLGIRYYINAVDMDGNQSILSEPVVISITDVQPPAAPTGVAVFGRDGDVALWWNPVSDVDVTNYRIVYGESGQGMTETWDAGLANRTIIQGLDPAKEYDLAVVAYDSSQNLSAPSDTVHVMPSAAETPVVFNSTMGATMAGVAVSLIDAENGEIVNMPLHPTRLTVQPNPVMTDEAGHYLYDFVNTGAYKVVVTAPARFTYPSRKGNDQLPPDFMIGTGSRGEAFNVANGAYTIRLDLPLDPWLAGDLNLDGAIDMTDAILCLQVMSTTSESMVTLEGDVNNDRKIGLHEVIYILQRVAGMRQN